MTVALVQGAVPQDLKWLRSQFLPTLDLYRQAIGLAARWKYSFYDSLIIAAALQSECEILYSEDLQHEQEVEGVTLMNPFFEIH